MAKEAAEYPHVFVNLAITADGKIATANRAVTSFGSRRDLAHLYELRATADAIICGARTIEESNSILDNGGETFRRQRLTEGRAEYNLRIIVTRNGTIDPEAEIFRHRFSPIIVLTTRRSPAKKRERLRPLVDEIKVGGEREINFRAAFGWLRARWGVKRLLCEGGGELNDALFRAGLVDEIHLTICPKIFGGGAAPTLADGLGCAELRLAAGFKIRSIREINGELFTTLAKENSDGK